MKPDREPPEPDRKRSDKKSQQQQVDFDRELDRGLEEVERALLALKERYDRVKQDKQQQMELQHRYEDVRQERRRNRSAELLTELRQIEQQLEMLEVNLESSLFSWSSLKEPFWMAVRFGGVGIIIGWLLKSYTS